MGFILFRIFTASCILIFSSNISFAEHEIDCGNANTQMDITDCAVGEAEKAEKEINSLWLAVKYHVEKFEGSPSSIKGYRKALLVSQRAWLKYRKAQCDWAAYEYNGDSTEKMVKALCFASVTRERIKYFRDYVKTQEEK